MIESNYISEDNQESLNDSFSMSSNSEDSFEFIKKNKYIELDENGISNEEFNKLSIKDQGKLNVKYCEICDRFYKNNFVILSDYGYICYHCLFWLNYSPNQRKQVDGTFGMTIAEYIMTCKDNHDKEKCTRNSDKGGCFICDYLNGIKIEGIKYPNILDKEIKGKSSSKQENLLFKDEIDNNMIVII